MHCYIFEISSAPIHEDEWYSTSDLPDWFQGAIADSSYDTDGEERRLAIEGFVKQFAPLCTYEDGRLQFTGNVKEHYFKSSYAEFHKAAATLVTTDYRTFSGQERSSEFIQAMSSLKQAFEEKFDHYIYLKDSEELVPMDSWVRDLNLSESICFGGVIDYHW